MIEQRAPDVEFLHVDAVERAHLVVRWLEEGDVVVVEVDSNGRCHRRERLEGERVQEFDAHVDVAVLLHPGAPVTVQRVRSIAADLEGAQDARAHHGHRSARTATGHVAGSKPCVWKSAIVRRSSPKPRQALCATAPSARRMSKTDPNLSWW